MSDSNNIDIQTKLLRATFLKNLVFFQQKMPELYELYRDYTPSKVKLTFDSNSNVNIVSNGSLVYANNPKESSSKQVDAYFHTPQQFITTLTFSEVPQYEQENQLRALYDRRNNLVDSDARYNLLGQGEQMDFMAMIGIGMGYHVEQLIQRSKIRYLFIWEPDKDIFHCAMHIIDFESIYKHCEKLSGSLVVKLGGNENHFVNEIDYLLKLYGHFNVARLYMYRHYKSDETEKGFENLSQLCYRFSSGLGFFEDEIISVSHTLTAIKQKLPLLKSPDFFGNPIANLPVFIIGNGPSLDNDLNFIKQNQCNAIILSCGTALKAVLDADIMPDFHIEMERVAATYEWIDKAGHKEKLKNIQTITLNNVYSEIYKLFQKSYIVPKPRDGGMDFLYEYIAKEDHPGVYACNPTVTNAATAIAIRLGFENLYLFGIDFGYKDETKHHASASMHNQPDFHGFTEKMASAFSVKGNFCDQVLTTQIFDSARGSMEMLLQAYPKVKCFNCSDGALIQLTTAVRSENIAAMTDIKDKSTQLESLLVNAFSKNIYGNLDFDKLFKNKLKIIKQAIDELRQSCLNEIGDRASLAILFSHQYQYVSQFSGNKETEIIYRFLNGTVNYFQTNIMANVFYFYQPSERKKYINWSLGIFEKHLSWLFDELESNYNKPSKY